MLDARIFIENVKGRMHICGKYVAVSQSSLDQNLTDERKKFSSPFGEKVNQNQDLILYIILLISLTFCFLYF